MDSERPGPLGLAGRVRLRGGARALLARFNTNIAVVDKRYFQGLPSPAAAALVAGFVWLAVDNKLPIHDSVMAWVAFTVTMYAGISMVSNAPFFSGKSFALGRSVPFWGILLVVAVFVFVSSDPPVVLFGLFVLYGLSGWIIWALRWNRARRLQQERRGQGRDIIAGMQLKNPPLGGFFMAEAFSAT